MMTSPCSTTGRFRWRSCGAGCWVTPSAAMAMWVVLVIPDVVDVVRASTSSAEAAEEDRGHEVVVRQRTSVAFAMGCRAGP